MTVAQNDRKFTKYLRNGKLITRRSLAYIERYPSPQELYQQIVDSKGWPYKSNRPFYLIRDRALIATLYLGAFRISEALRLKRSQFTCEKGLWIVTGVLLSKRRQFKQAYRPEVFFTRTGKRRMFTLLIEDYFNWLDRNADSRDLLWPFSRSRAWQIITATLGHPEHWLRAFGENFLYDEWDHDLLAVAEYIGVSAMTLPEYIRRSYRKYKPV